MSGFIGLVSFDGRPVDRRLLRELTESMALRGPDGRQTWSRETAGLGFAKLATTENARCEEQPLSLDGKIWIVADARLDGRPELISRLESTGAQRVGGATDAELILHAYRIWGEGMPARLLGDFSFAIWDQPRRTLFCARDPFGIKPFYYAEQADGIAFSNALDCLCRHPAVSPELNDRAIADFLLFESNQDPASTTYADVSRLPAAHQLIKTPEQLTVCRYWRLPSEVESAAVPAAGWVEQFRTVLTTAIEDRLPAQPVAVLMSGGLDSTAVAALAHRLSKESGRAAGISCYTACYDRLIADPEEHYARLVTEHLSIPCRVLPLDDYRLTERWGELPKHPEPSEHTLDAMVFDVERAIGARHRVAFTGLGADPLLFPFVGYFLSQLKTGRIDRALRYLIEPLLGGRRRPPLGLHRQWMRWRLRRRWRAGYPDWLAPDLETRLGLEDRWRWYRLERRGKPPHPSHPDAGWLLTDPFWVNAFEQMDAAIGIGGVERRHPFFDLRLLELVFQAPPIPWCLDKHLLREAMRGLLPEAVRVRPKTPVVGYPRHLSERPLDEIWTELVQRTPAIARYVRPEKATEGLKRPDPETVLRPLCLAHWLSSS